MMSPGFTTTANFWQTSAHSGGGSIFQRLRPLICACHDGSMIWSWCMSAPVKQNRTEQNKTKQSKTKQEQKRNQKRTNHWFKNDQMKSNKGVVPFCPGPGKLDLVWFHLRCCCIHAIWDWIYGLVSFVLRVHQPQSHGHPLLCTTRYGTHQPPDHASSSAGIIHAYGKMRYGKVRS